jgi:hypothetical protein
MQSGPPCSSEKVTRMSSGSGNSESPGKTKVYSSGERVRRFAWLPRRLSNGSWIWLKSYYIRFPYVLDPDGFGKRRRR